MCSTLSVLYILVLSTCKLYNTCVPTYQMYTRMYNCILNAVIVKKGRCMFILVLTYCYNKCRVTSVRLTECKVNKWYYIICWLNIGTTCIFLSQSCCIICGQVSCGLFYGMYHVLLTWYHGRKAILPSLYSQKMHQITFEEAKMCKNHQNVKNVGGKYCSY